MRGLQEKWVARRDKCPFSDIYDRQSIMSAHVVLPLHLWHELVPIISAFVNAIIVIGDSKPAIRSRQHGRGCGKRDEDLNRNRLDQRRA